MFVPIDVGVDTGAADRPPGPASGPPDLVHLLPKSELPSAVIVKLPVILSEPLFAPLVRAILPQRRGGATGVTGSRRVTAAAAAARRAAASGGVRRIGHLARDPRRRRAPGRLPVPRRLVAALGVRAMRVGDEGSLAVPSRVEAEGAHKTPGAPGSGSKLIWRAPTTGRTRSCNVAASLTGATSSTTTAPDGTPSRATADRTCAIGVPCSTPIATRFLASSASTHTAPRIASAVAGRPTLPAFQRSPVVVRPAHPKRGDPRDPARRARAREPAPPAPGPTRPGGRRSEHLPDRRRSRRIRGRCGRGRRDRRVAGVGRSRPCRRMKAWAG